MSRLCLHRIHSCRRSRVATFPGILCPRVPKNIMELDSMPACLRILICTYWGKIRGKMLGSLTQDRPPPWQMPSDRDQNLDVRFTCMNLKSRQSKGRSAFLTWFICKFSTSPRTSLLLSQPGEGECVSVLRRAAAQSLSHNSTAIMRC